VGSVFYVLRVFHYRYLDAIASTYRSGGCTENRFTKQLVTGTTVWSLYNMFLVIAVYTEGENKGFFKKETAF
jgi:hypothetical protein